MIAVDTSALLAVVLNETESTQFDELLIFHDCLIGAPALLEATMALARFGNPANAENLTFLIRRPNVEIVPFDEEQAQTAAFAFRRFGRRSGHRAQLNFGDCMSYALARQRDLPLLFKGNDFGHTDIKPVRLP